MSNINTYIDYVAKVQTAINTGATLNTLNDFFNGPDLADKGLAALGLIHGWAESAKGGTTSADRINKEVISWPVNRPSFNH